MRRRAARGTLPFRTTVDHSRARPHVHSFDSAGQERVEYVCCEYQLVVLRSELTRVKVLLVQVHGLRQAQAWPDPRSGGVPFPQAKARFPAIISLYSIKRVVVLAGWQRLQRDIQAGDIPRAAPCILRRARSRSGDDTGLDHLKRRRLHTRASPTPGGPCRLRLDQIDGAVGHAHSLDRCRSPTASSSELSVEVPDDNTFGRYQRGVV